MVFEGERESQADPWRRLLADNISEVIGEAARREIVPEEDASSFPCDTEGNVRWTRTVIGRMDKLMDEEDRIEVLTRCAHVMPESSIRVLREIYERNHDVEELREFWQEQFIDNLKDWYDPIPQKWMDTVVREHWGQVGTREENVIIATKIRENMKGFFEAKDDNERKYHYCHCARIKGTFRMDYIRISPTYCYCGGGYYESNWERIIGKPVKVRLLKSVLKGDDVCQFVICLPEGI